MKTYDIFNLLVADVTLFSICAFTSSPFSDRLVYLYAKAFLMFSMPLIRRSIEEKEEKKKKTNDDQRKCVRGKKKSHEFNQFIQFIRVSFN